MPLLSLVEKDVIDPSVSGLQKKTQKTPQKEIDRAVRIMPEYYNDKKEEK